MVCLLNTPQSGEFLEAVVAPAEYLETHTEVNITTYQVW